jgi:hypothetical protein
VLTHFVISDFVADTVEALVIDDDFGTAEENPGRPK